MIPQGGALPVAQDIEIEEQPSYTYKLDLDKKRIVGMTDNIDAIKQAVYKILQTERFEHLIYSSNYGSELTPLIGSSRLFFQSEVNRRIREALLADDRITDVQNLRVTFGEGSALVEFVVVSEYGNFPVSQEVMR